MSLDTWYATGDRFEWRGQQVFYQEDGEGDAIFLLHGFATSSWIYKLIWPLLTKYYRVIAPDFVGFGFSSKPRDYRYGFEERVEMLYALAALLNVQSCHIMAHSFGVNVAQELLFRHDHDSSPIQILSVGLLNGAIFHDQSVPSFRQRMMLTPIGRIVARALGRSAFKGGFRSRVGAFATFPDDLLDDLYYQLELNGGLRLIHRHNKYLLERKHKKKMLQKALIETKVPIQLLWGIEKEDQLAGIKLAHKYREVKGSEYVVMLKGIGHFPMVENPQMVADHYLNFLRGLPKA